MSFFYLRVNKKELFMKCYGEKSRERIVTKYQLKPIAHVSLLIGQTKQSCTGQTLTDSYYCFNYTSKDNSRVKKEGTFFCGSVAAAHFLKLIGHDSLPLFNPLIAHGDPLENNQNHRNQGGARINWHPLAKQLNDAINMLIICWDIVPGGALAEIQSELNKYPYSEPFMRKLKAVNTIISRDIGKKTLQEMIGDLRIAGHDIRDFQFDLINAKLDEEGVTSYFG